MVVVVVVVFSAHRWICWVFVLKLWFGILPQGQWWSEGSLAALRPGEERMKAIQCKCFRRLLRLNTQGSAENVSSFLPWKGACWGERAVLFSVSVHHQIIVGFLSFPSLCEEYGHYYDKVLIIRHLTSWIWCLIWLYPRLQCTVCSGVGSEVNSPF